ncbi:MAG: hypothetical protein JW791_02505 [Nanoarchaeota archaeon]|nr:hypothetical protein [Nanoarchaeota archaeon]
MIHGIYAIDEGRFDPRMLQGLDSVMIANNAYQMRCNGSFCELYVVNTKKKLYKWGFMTPKGTVELKNMEVILA